MIYVFVSDYTTNKHIDGIQFAQMVSPQNNLCND